MGGVCFTGGLGSPRPYGREHLHSHPPPSSPYHSSLPPPPSHPQQPPNLPPPPPQAQSQPMMYQQHQDSQYCPSYDPMVYSGVDRGRQLPPPHLQPGKCAKETGETTNIKTLGHHHLRYHFVSYMCSQQKQYHVDSKSFQKWSVIKFWNFARSSNF